MNSRHYNPKQYQNYYQGSAPQHAVQGNVPREQWQPITNPQSHYQSPNGADQQQILYYPNADYRPQGPYYGNMPAEQSVESRHYQFANIPPQISNPRNFPMSNSGHRYPSHYYPNSNYRKELDARNIQPQRQLQQSYSFDPSRSQLQMNNSVTQNYVPQRHFVEQRPQQYYSKPLNQNYDPSKVRQSNMNIMQRLSSSPVMAPAPSKGNTLIGQQVKPKFSQLQVDPSLNSTMLTANDFHLRQVLSSGNPELLNTVEATEPIIKTIHKRTNVGSVDLKKILLSLKSGLLAESTWALDTLNIITSNERFKVPSGLFMILLDYYKCFLNAVFDDLFIDTESDFQSKILKRLTNSYNEDAFQNELENIETGDKLSLLDSINYTFKSRNGLPVKVKKDCLTHKIQDYNAPDEVCDFEFFKNGNNLSTSHIIESMQPSFTIPFNKTLDDNQNEFTMQNCFDENMQPNKDSDSEAELYPSYTVLCPRKETVDLLLRRCFCISNIISNLSFMQENYQIMSQSPGLLLILGRILLFEHKHLIKKNFDRVVKENENKTLEKEKSEAREIFKDSLLDGLHFIRMNSFTTISNLSEFLDLSNFSDKIILPILDSLLHWATCQSSYAKDACSPDNLSYQVITLEILAKLSICVSNVDLVLATPPFTRIEEFYKILVNQIDQTNDQVIRELSLVILSNFAKNDTLSARIILHQNFSILNLLTFIEKHETLQRRRYINEYNIRADPYEIPTISYMCKLAASTLLILSSECDPNDLHLIKKFESRFLSLTMSHCLDPEVLKILANLVYTLSNKKV